MANRIKTKGNLAPVRYWEGRTVLKSYMGELQLAVNFLTPESAQAEIVAADSDHRAKCEDTSRWYIENERPVPEQFVYPSWTWRIATEDDINA